MVQPPYAILVDMGFRNVIANLRAMQDVLLKAFFFGMAWNFLPTWIFVPIALGLYFIPTFQTKKLLAPFAAILLLCFSRTPSFAYALILCVVFGWMLFIKELMLVDRRSAYEILIVALSYLLIGNEFSGSPLPLSSVSFRDFILAIVLGAMVGSLAGLTSGVDVPSGRRIESIIALLCFLIMWQVFLVCRFLPAPGSYQALIAFIIAVATADILPRGFSGYPATKLVASGLFFAVLLTVSLFSVKWGL